LLESWPEISHCNATRLLPHRAPPFAKKLRSRTA